MKKSTCKIEDIIENYKHLMHLDYKNKCSKFYCSLERALNIIGFEVAVQDKYLIGKYESIKDYLKLEICKFDEENLSPKELNSLMNKLIKNNRFENIDDLLKFCFEYEILIVGKKNKKFIEDVIELENNEIEYTYDDEYSKRYTSKSYKDFLNKIEFFQY